MSFSQSLKESKAKMCVKPFSLFVTILAQRDKSYAKLMNVERGKKGEWVCLSLLGQCYLWDLKTKNWKKERKEKGFLL